MSDAKFDLVLEHYRRRQEQERLRRATLTPEEALAHRDEFLLPVGEAVGGMMREIIVGLGAGTIVEVGSSYGFSTLFLADAARQSGGRLFSYEQADFKQNYARAKLAEAGLADHVEWRLGDAVALLADQPGPVDFVLIDLWKNLYVPCFEVLHPKLGAGAVVIGDNMLFPQAARPHAEAYRAAVQAKADMTELMLPINEGISIARKAG